MFDIPKLKKVIYLNFPARLILARYLVQLLTNFIFIKTMGGCLQPNNPRIQQPELKTKHKCNICLDDIQTRESRTTLNCAHSFHKECLLKTYRVRIYQRNFPMKCPDCNIQVNYYVMKNILTEDLFTLYEKILLINALLLDQHRFFCPTPDCPAIYEIIPSQFRYFDCRACKKEFCLVCHRAYHGKRECVVQTKQQIADHSIECPNKKCKIDWFKIDGCNHVQCLICHHKFCYKCKGPSCGVTRCNNDSIKK